MIRPTEISLVDYYNLPTTNTANSNIEFPNPEIGKIYRKPYDIAIPFQLVTIILIIGIEKENVPHFKYAYPPRIKQIHIEERKIYIKE